MYPKHGVEYVRMLKSDFSCCKKFIMDSRNKLVKAKMHICHRAGAAHSYGNTEKNLTAQCAELAVRPYARIRVKS